MSTDAPWSAGGTAPLPEGAVVGGRFEAQRPIAADSLGTLVGAADQKTQKAISLRLVRESLTEGAHQKTIRAACREIADVQHPSIVSTYGVGKTPARGLFIAGEGLSGARLSDLIRKRREQGGHMSLRGAFNVISHVGKALSHVQDRIAHGALRPEAVWITHAGRVKVTDFGLASAVLATHGPGAFGAEEAASLAPEVKGGQAPTNRSDIFGLGAILYQLLTGRSPAEGFVPPSQAHPHATEAIDQVLLRCLSRDPGARFASADDVRAALLPLIAHAPPAEAEADFGFDIDIDVDVEDVEGPKDPAAEAAAARASASAPTVGSRVSLEEGFRDHAPSAAAPRASAVDLSTAVAKITEDTAPKFMLVKSGLDHGPFSGRDLVQLIMEGEVEREHIILDMPTGTRRAVSDWPEFAAVLDEYVERVGHEEHKAAVAAADVAERESGKTKVIAGSVALGLVAAAALAFVLTRGESEDAGPVAAAAPAEHLYEVGEIEVEGTAALLPDPPRGGHGRGHGRGHGSGMGSGGAGAGGDVGGAGSYEEAMARAADLGDVTGMRGVGRLSPSVVAQTMNRNIGRIYGACVPAARSRGEHLGTVNIDIAIAGDGHVLGASTRTGSPQFRSCIGRAVRRVRFPTFSSPRMGARFQFSAG